MTPDPIEAVARAICTVFEDGSPFLAQTINMEPSAWHAEARAAIAAMPKVEAGEVARLRGLVERAVQIIPDYQVNWHAAARDALTPEPDTIGYVDDTGGPR